MEFNKLENLLKKKDQEIIEESINYKYSDEPWTEYFLTKVKYYHPDRFNRIIPIFKKRGLDVAKKEYARMYGDQDVLLPIGSIIRSQKELIGDFINFIPTVKISKIVKDFSTEAFSSIINFDSNYNLYNEIFKILKNIYGRKFGEDKLFELNTNLNTPTGEDYFNRIVKELDLNRELFFRCKAEIKKQIENERIKNKQ